MDFKFTTLAVDQIPIARVFAESDYAGDVMTIFVEVNGQKSPLVGVENRGGKLIVTRWSPSTLKGAEPFERDDHGRVLDKFRTVTW